MDELRGLPHNTEAEQSVIGSMLLDPRSIPAVVERLGGEDFYLPAHQDIFDAIYAMFARNAVYDPVTLMDEMRLRGTFDENSTFDYINRLLDITPTSAHAAQYADIVRRSSLLRKLDTVAGEMSSRAREPGADADAVLDGAEQSIYDLRQGREVTTLYKIPVVLMEVYRNIKEIADAGGKLPGIPSGIADLDETIGGMLNSSFIIVASRPGVGKTSFMLGLGLSAARISNKNVVFFSLEMSRDQLVSRLLANESRINSKKLLTGDLDAKEWMALGQASSALSRMPYLFDDNPVISVEQMKAKCRRVPNLGLVVIDYLQLMHGSRKRYDNRTTEVGDISRSLKIMAKEL
ncbi:MAG: replicative DNA helicase, partial [Oscillospiraceae bacterium]|nr:replicative DNA helicase [Oscillospiraceae bacterium]